MTLLEVENLRVELPRHPDRPSYPVDGVSFAVERGETLALVGESGSGKSLTALALLGLLPPPAVLVPGSRIRLDGTDLATMPERDLRRVRGGRIGIVFQDPAASLDPMYSAGDHVIEAIRAVRQMTRLEAKALATQLFAEVGFPRDRMEAYPHQLSGGLRQRVMLAVALAGEPDLLIADEPTSALDVTVQAQVLETLDRLRTSRGMAMLLISHNLGVVVGRAERVAVMYAGQVVESGPTREVFAAPAHPYTRALLAAVPRLRQVSPVAPPIAPPAPARGEWPTACRLATRCPIAVPQCSSEAPPMVVLTRNRAARCWFAEPRAP